jgi:UDP-N-acetylglucosamine transferase subunit ALG13
MHQTQPEKYGKNLRILVAPLDWGLGHVTRCIPIIKELLQNNCDIWLAGNETQRSLLKTEFPDLPFLLLPGYRIKYSKLRATWRWKMLLQLPKIFSAAGSENKWLKEMISEYRLDAVISDSRIGLWNDSIPTVFITHQLIMKTFSGKWTERILQRLNYKWINRFSECWVPDVEEEKNLAGQLSHPLKKPKIPVHYIGTLSRFENAPSPAAEDKNHLLVILSGPEPQRTILENKIINEVAHYPSTATVVRGLPGSANIIPSTAMIKFFNHLPAQKLENEIERAEWVISRSGYSTVMDLMRLQKKSILIPTPGQTEQEYLAEHLMENKQAFCTPQKNFSLYLALNAASLFDYQLTRFDQTEKFKTIIKNFVDRLSK